MCMVVGVKRCAMIHMLVLCVCAVCCVCDSVRLWGSGRLPLLLTDLQGDGKQAWGEEVEMGEGIGVCCWFYRCVYCIWHSFSLPLTFSPSIKLGVSLCEMMKSNHWTLGQSHLSISIQITKRLLCQLICSIRAGPRPHDWNCKQMFDDGADLCWLQDWAEAESEWVKMSRGKNCEFWREKDRRSFNAKSLQCQLLV